VAQALSDIRVLDLTVARAGPTCVRQLADWGADVVKVEPLRPATSGLEDNRHGSDFQNLHRNKRSVAIDLKSEAGLALFHRMVTSADVVVENMRPPVKHRLGVDYETLRRINPRLVYGSISGFGQDGPYAERGGVDQIAQGLSGLMSVTGLPGQGPVRTGVAITDLAAGMYLAIGVLAALHERERSGQGQWVRTSLLEAGIAMLDFQAARWTVDGVVAPQAGNHHPTHIPMGCFATADGSVNIAGAGGHMLGSFFEAIGAPEVPTDPRFDTAAKRSANRDELNALVQERLLTRTTAEWVDALNAVGVPAGPVHTIDAVFADEQVRHLEMVGTVEHPALGPLHLLRNAVSMSRTPEMMRQASPEAGQHTDEVLGDLGLTADEIDDLRGRRVIS
jgi:formyl-CoA transferase